MHGIQKQSERKIPSYKTWLNVGKNINVLNCDNNIPVTHIHPNKKGRIQWML